MGACRCVSSYSLTWRCSVSWHIGGVTCGRRVHGWLLFVWCRRLWGQIASKRQEQVARVEVYLKQGQVETRDRTPHTTCTYCIISFRRDAHPGRVLTKIKLHQWEAQTVSFDVFPGQFSALFSLFLLFTHRPTGSPFFSPPCFPTNTSGFWLQVLSVTCLFLFLARCVRLFSSAEYFGKF